MPRGSPPTGTAAVFVVGSVNADVILPVARLPAPGETVLAGDPVHLGGGKGANVAVAAARDGAAVRLVAAVGDDDAGRCGRAELEREAVDVAGVATVTGRPTGMAMVCVDRASENLIVVAPGANAALDAAHVAGGLDALGRDDVCVVSFEVPAQAVARAAAVAAERGARLVVNPSPVRSVDGLAGARATLVLNAGELAQLAAGARPDEGAAALRRAGWGRVVVTLGADGVLVAAGDEAPARIAAHPVASVDTTGAGDTFTGVLAAALAAGADVLDAARRGAAAAALSTQRVGAREGMPRAVETDRLVGGP